MRTSTVAWLSIMLAGALAGCGDNLKPEQPVDAGIDAIACPVRQPGQVGGPCTTDTQCDSAPGAADGLCLNAALGGIGWPTEGYCVNKIDLVSMDCSNGCDTDADCGTGNVCVSVEGCNACVAGCTCPGGECPDGQVCTDTLIGGALGKSACLPGNAAATDGAACAGFSECAADSICFGDVLEHPGGQCATVGCTVGDDSTCADGGDGHCINLATINSGTGCVDACTVDADCRMAQGYRCFDGGAGAGKYCRHPQTGDACATAADCGEAGLWECRTGAQYPGGYCTPVAACNPANGAGCSPGSSICFDPPGAAAPYCVDRCAAQGQSTCRPTYTCSVIGNARGCLFF